MRIILLIIIRSYWFLIPKSKRRRCLFKLSCSNYVFRKTKKEGFIEGLKALRFRVDNCNSNYCIIELDGQMILVTNSNKIFYEHEMSNSILK